MSDDNATNVEIGTEVAGTASIDLTADWMAETLRA